MVGEVNKIIYNMLISGKGVFLPEVGTLFIERQGARRIAKNKLLSPRNIVSFASQAQAPSLVDEIVSVAGCEVSQAQDIYERWLQKTREGEVVTIEGIGVLNRKSFSVESAFASAINPTGVKTLVVRRRSNTWLYVLCAVCVAVALGIFAYIMWGDKLKESAKCVTTEQTVEASADGAVVADSVAVSDGVVSDVTAQESAVATDVIATTSTATTVEVAKPSNEDFAYYVVMGVFSSEQNAERAVAQAKSRLPEARCAVLPFKGDKFMVTVYGSDNLAECNDFVKRSRAVFSDLWVYNKR